MSSLFTRAIDTDQMLAAIQKDIERAGISSLSNIEFCRLLSFVDHWDFEADRFKFKVAQSGNNLINCYRYSNSSHHDHVGQACHFSMNHQADVGVRNTIVLSWAIANQTGGYPTDVEDYYCDVEAWLKAVNESKYSSKAVREFYEWFSKPDQNPVLRAALPCMKDVEWYRHEDGRLFGFSYTVKEADKTLLGQLHALSRFMFDGYYATLTQNRASHYNMWRDKGYSVLVSVIASEYPSRNLTSGHLILNHNPNTFYNWMTFNRQNALYWTQSFNHAAPEKYHVEEYDFASVDKVIKQMKKDGLEIGPVSKK